MLHHLLPSVEMHSTGGTLPVCILLGNNCLPLYNVCEFEYPWGCLYLFVPLIRPDMSLAVLVMLLGVFTDIG